MVAGRQPVKLPFPFIDGLTRRQQEELYLDFQALANQGTGTRWATLVIAPSDATAKSKSKADYVLDGISDSAVIETAVALLDGRGTPGRIVILEGTVYATAAIDLTLADSVSGRLVIQGMGGYGTDTATKITNNSGSNNLFVLNGTTSGTTRFGFMGLQMDSNSASCIVTSATSVDVDACSFSGSGRLIDLSGGLSGPYAASRIRNSNFAVSGSGGAGRGIVVSHEFKTMIHGNTMTCSTGRAISLYGNAAATIEPTVTANRISCSGTAVGIYMTDSTDATTVKNAVISGNYISGGTTGIVMEGTTDSLIVGNTITGCTNGIHVRGSAIIGNHRALITSNYIHSCSGEGVNVDNSTLGTDDISVVFNKFRGNGNQGSIAASCVNCAWAYNDAYSSGSFTDAGTSTRTEVTFLPTTLDANARVGVRKNSAGTTYLRRRLNFIDASPLSITMADDSGSEEVDLTLAFDQSVALNNNARVAIRKNSTGSDFTRRRVNLIEGSNVTLTVADDSGNEEVDVTIAAATGGGTANYQVNGVAVASEATLNLVQGSGVTIAGVDAGTVVDVTISAGTSAATAAGEFNYHFHG